MNNLLDKAVSFFSPGAGLKRTEARIKTAAMSSYADAAGFITAGSGKRSTQGWRVQKLSPDSDILPKHSNQIASSRDLYMNTPMAGAIIRRKCSAAVGFGLNLQSRVDRKALGLSDNEADEWQRNIESLFRVYTDSADVDITRTLNFYQLQALAFFSQQLSGDVFFMLPWVQVPGFAFETRVKIVEADLCRSPEMNDLDGKKAGGIELDEYGAPLAYWFAKRYPAGEDLINTELDNAHIRIPAFDSTSGRRNVYHVFDRERPGQRRGTPLLARVFEVLKQVSRLSEAKLMHHLLQSFFSVFVTNEAGVASMENPYGVEDSVLTPEEQSIGDKIELGSGNVVEMDGARKITVADPGRSDIGYGSFFDSLISQIAAAEGIPFGTLMLRFQASYSATRGERLEFEREYMIARRNFALQFCQPVYEAWLYEMVIKGVVDAPGFLENPITRAYWCRTKWNGSGKGQIDPVKETEAAIMRINNNLSTHADEYAEASGGNWENECYTTRVREFNMIEKAGLRPMPKPGKVDVTPKPDAKKESTEEGQ